MKFHRVHTRVKAIDSDHNRLMTLESFNGWTWNFYCEEGSFYMVFEANSYRDASHKAKIRYLNWLIATGQEQ